MNFSISCNIFPNGIKPWSITVYDEVEKSGAYPLLDKNDPLTDDGVR
jgi:hypothetical protein